MGDIETIKEFRTRRASSKKISRNVCLSNGDTGGTNVYTRRMAGFERSTIDFEKERRILPRSSSPRVFSFSKTVFRKLLLSNGRNDDIVSSVESIHRGNSIYREKGINDTKFKQTRRWCVFIRMEIWSILSREERNDNIVPSIVFGQVNNPLSTIEHWMTGPNIPRLTTYFVG